MHTFETKDTDWLNFVQFGEVRVEAGELLGKLPDSDDEEKNIEEDDGTHRSEEAPDEAVFQR